MAEILETKNLFKLKNFFKINDLKSRIFFIKKKDVKLLAYIFIV